jgi:heme/copper-type cytochrome/quinol oxidase subunit 2
MNEIWSPRWYRLGLLVIALVFGGFPSGCGDVVRPGSGQRPMKAEGGPVAAAGAPQFSEPYLIEITGSAGRWHVRYPGVTPRLVPGSEAPLGQTVHVPLRTHVILLLKSEDYIYTLALPGYGLKEIAVPEYEFRIEFCPDDAGESALVGDQLCGDPHPGLQGHLVVETRERFLKWLQDGCSGACD